MKKDRIEVLYKEWLNSPSITKEEKEILLKMSEEEKDDAFFKEIEFGTGGLRGKIGPGLNRINEHIVKKITLAYAIYLKNNKFDLKKGVVIAHDNRYKSHEFSLLISKELNELGINSFIFDSLRPTPELSFAVRYKKALGGIMITASHNKKEDNGYKLYDETGAQMVVSQIAPICELIKNLGDSLSLKIEKVKVQGKEEVLKSDLDDEYIKNVLKIPLNPSIKKPLKIVYTPNHGASYINSMRVLKESGYDVVPFLAQCTPDPNFTNVDVPNPEEEKAYEKPIKFAKENNADLILMNDPDGDRVGIAFKNKDGDFERINGNESASLLLYYILDNLKKQGRLLSNGVVFNTIVTSFLGKKICESFNIRLESFLTGFKYIGERIHYYEMHQNQCKFIFGYEESDGCLYSPFVRDKDGTQAVLLYAELASFYANKSMNLKEAYKELEEKYGYFHSILFSIYFEGSNGQEEMVKILQKIRAKPFKNLLDKKVEKFFDYDSQEGFDYNKNKTIFNDFLPKSNVLRFDFTDGSNIEIRPSGTEPKCKFYIEIVQKDEFNEDIIKEYFKELKKLYSIR